MKWAMPVLLRDFFGLLQANFGSSAREEHSHDGPM